MSRLLSPKGFGKRVHSIADFASYVLDQLNEVFPSTRHKGKLWASNLIVKITSHSLK